MPGSAPRAGRLAQHRGEAKPPAADSGAFTRGHPDTKCGGRGAAGGRGVGSSAGSRAGASPGAPRGAGSVPGSAPRRAAACRRPSLPARGTDAEQRFGWVLLVVFFFF